MISDQRKRATETVKLLKLWAKEPAVLMDGGIVHLKIKLYFLSAEIGSEESNWSAEIMQSKISEGSDSGSMPINCHHCLTQLVAMVKSAFDSSLQCAREDWFDSPHSGIL